VGEVLLLPADAEPANASPPFAAVPRAAPLQTREVAPEHRGEAALRRRVVEVGPALPFVEALVVDASPSVGRADTHPGHPSPQWVLRELLREVLFGRGHHSPPIAARTASAYRPSSPIESHAGSSAHSAASSRTEACLGSSIRWHVRQAHSPTSCAP